MTDLSSTDQNHPITPPPELRRLWAQQAQRMDPYDPVALIKHVSTQAARWGGDQELEACCEWLTEQCLHLDGSYLRADRRPPSSLKEQAQAELDRLIALIPTEGAMAMAEPIRRALETLND